MMLKKATTTFIALLFIIGALLLLWANRYNIHDFIILRSYKPPSTIVQLASDDTMTPQGKRLFYVNKPQISDKSTFSGECKTTEQTIVLGCYTGNHIYIEKIDDPTLDGVEQVTAAHEMLHAAYARLSPSQRSKVDAMVTAEYKKLNDPRINSLIASYQKQEPGSTANELHSILGTEIGNIGSQLEAYYSQYFTNRAQIVTYGSDYQKVFDNLKIQADQLKADLNAQKADIEQRETALNNQSQQLSLQKSNMDSLEAGSQTAAYNARVGPYNNSVDAYNNALSALKQLISQYNGEIQKYNQLVISQNSLFNEINSNQNTIPNQ